MARARAHVSPLRYHITNLLLLYGDESAGLNEDGGAYGKKTKEAAPSPPSVTHSLSLS